ncbi:PTS galactosamine/N-acetylgalactosamine transporter subunit IIA [Jeongeupia sp. USM3]|uniref:PTS galactosamine/N-acetylgalactosamine transporter subunit IIA n=1 Tax=Jeongeupia sp. USM3 TaxID=1906741 RepID=UPI00089E0993|nr:PTS galactosamine/N-acetylgalactosamine transporter subunit IIA [Jeongeupia sp. USM3]AOX99410.1 PTS N-acetylgalactosamine transporter subunit IIA [Jeongeupia sp. USM3]
MISLIVTGHGRFASGLLGAVEQVFGPQAQAVAVDFPPELGTAELEAHLNAAVASLPAGAGIVFLTDLLGGSPFKLASQIALAQSQPCDVIAGSNMAMFAEVALERDEIAGVGDFVTRAQAAGRAGVASLRERLARQQARASAQDDGL